MKIRETGIVGCNIIYPDIFNDERGSFCETYNKERYIKEGAIDSGTTFIQDNLSFSAWATIRGLHFQKGEHAQAKLVSCLMGEVMDVIVDCRESSKSFGKIVIYTLDSVDKHQIFIPRGCAHGFAVISASAYFYYKCDNYYNKDAEGGILYNDEKLEIDWPFIENHRKISEKDLELPKWSKAYKFK
ncbi:MAG: dTDP-4-dehydrorhamnose 3,5-epimerase [Richelia sp. RM2_1_2]|nr:dTDP-4-dehydrorhamnose 3,5-epimerase [Richelia sp. RM2_1_2]